MRKNLQKMASIHWIGIHFSEQQQIPSIDSKISFCEAISKAVINSHFVLTSKNFDANNINYLS